MVAPTPRIRIGELARRSGVRAETIRVWERRYGLLDPQRTAGGYRLYSPEDEARLRLMRELIDAGVATAEAAEQSKRQASPALGAGARGADAASQAPSAVDPAGQATRLVAAIEVFDGAAADAILDEALGALSLDRFVEGVALPAMAEVGERWEAGTISVAQEHYASTVVRSRLLGLGRGWGVGVGPLAVLACPPDEQHDIGLIAFGLVLRERGWRVTYLGQDTPIEQLEEVADASRADLAVLGSQRPEQVRAVAGAVGRLAERVPVLIGGRGVEGAAEIAGVVAVRSGPVEAAETIGAHLVRPQA